MPLRGSALNSLATRSTQQRGKLSHKMFVRTSRETFNDERIAREEERRRETWFGLLGAAFLGAFLLIFFQGSLVQGFQSLTASPTSPVVRSSSQGVVIAPNVGSTLTPTVP